MHLQLCKIELIRWSLGTIEEVGIAHCECQDLAAVPTSWSSVPCVVFALLQATIIRLVGDVPKACLLQIIGSEQRVADDVVDSMLATLRIRLPLEEASE